MLASVMFIYWVMRTNTFAAPVIKIQKDRGQAVITTGPYGIVRHPMYFGALFYIAGTSLALGSWWGLALVPILGGLLMIHRHRGKRRCAWASMAMTIMPGGCAELKFRSGESGAPAANSGKHYLIMAHGSADL